MSVSRISSVTMTGTAQRNLAAAQQRLAAAHEKASSLKEVSKPSDNPTAAAEAMRVRTAQRAAEQHTRNVNNANGWLSTADSALSEAVNLMHQVRDTVLAAANQGAADQGARDAHALQLENLRSGLLDAANTEFMGRHVFAGTSDAAEAFTADGEHTGTPGAEVTRRVGETTEVRVDADGAAAFGSGEESLFTLITDIAADIRAGEPLSGRLGELDERLDGILSVQASVGAAQATALRAEEALVAEKVNLETRRSTLEDADLASVALDLQAQELAYQAALASSARVLQNSLMDYLR